MPPNLAPARQTGQTHPYGAPTSLTAPRERTRNSALCWRRCRKLPVARLEFHKRDFFGTQRQRTLRKPATLSPAATGAAACPWKDSAN